MKKQAEDRLCPFCDCPLAGPLAKATRSDPVTGQDVRVAVCLCIHCDNTIEIGEGHEPRWSFGQT